MKNRHQDTNDEDVLTQMKLNQKSAKKYKFELIWTYYWHILPVGITSVDTRPPVSTRSRTTRYRRLTVSPPIQTCTVTGVALRGRHLFTVAAVQTGGAAAHQVSSTRPPRVSSSTEAGKVTQPSLYAGSTIEARANPTGVHALTPR